MSEEFTEELRQAWIQEYIDYVDRTEVLPSLIWGCEAMVREGKEPPCNIDELKEMLKKLEDKHDLKMSKTTVEDLQWKGWL